MTHGSWPTATVVPLFPAIVILGILVFGNNLTNAQTKSVKQSQKDGTIPSSTGWIEDKVSVRVESPYLSDSGSMVLAYTVTNKSGQDIDLDFSENSPVSLKPHVPTRVYLKLKDPRSYLQVTPKSNFLSLVETLLPADLPVSFHIVVTVSADEKPSWFASESSEDRLRRLLKEKLGNTECITVFVPDRHIKITFAIPRGLRK
ncbi:MAG: hypothetical protein ACRD50_04470 [Candidatus Acidiferrales bacterium]